MKACSTGIDCQIVVESNHRIANHMAMLAGYVALRRREFSRMPDADNAGEVLRLLGGIGAQVTAVSELHRMLTTSVFVDSGDIAAQLGRICEAFRKGPACGTAIEYTAGAGCILPVRHILPVSQIVSEVVTNALKYGHKAGCAGTIRVACLRGSDNRIRISVEDDGDGFLPGTASTKPKGTGVAMIGALVRQVGGAIEYRSAGTGVIFSLSLPSAGPPMPKQQPLLGQFNCIGA